MPGATINYSNNFIAGACLLPTYICAGILLSSASVFIWLAGMVLMLIFCSAMYTSLVLKPLNSHVATWKRYLLVFFVQIIFWTFAIYLGSILK